MLSSRRFFGNAGRSRWMAGSGLPAFSNALQDWTRTEVALDMPTTMGVPVGYGGLSLALPRAPGSISSRGATTIALTASGNASRGLDVAGSAGITIGTAGAVFGVGAVAGNASIALAAPGDVYGQAAVAGEADIAIGATGSIGGIAYLAGSANIALTALSTMGCIATVGGTAYLSAAAEGGTLTESGIAAAVWDALSASFGDADTMGALLIAAGSGGMDPALIAKINDLWQRLGLDPDNPMTTTDTHITAGAIDIEMVEGPPGTVVSTRQ